MVEIQCFLDSSHVRVPYGPNETNENFKGAIRNVKNYQKKAKKVKRVIFKGDSSLETLL